LRRVVLATAIVIGMFGVAAAPAGGYAGFGDIALGRFFTEAVQWMVDNKYTTGITPTCFAPDDPVTRGQAATFLHRIEGSPPVSSSHPFVDVVADWQQDAVDWLWDKKLTTGTTPTTYEPERTLTRGEMAALIWRTAGEPGGSPPHPFVDVSRPWQQEPISWMADKGITTGKDPTHFAPEDPVTRGEFATFGYRWKESPAVVVDDYTPLCSTSDDFDGGLELGWEWLSGDPAARSFTTMPGYLSMTGPSGGSSFGDQVLVREPVADNYTIETKVSFAPVANFQGAGLTIRTDANNEVAIGRGYCNAPLCVADGVYFDNVVDGNVVGGSTNFDFDAVALPTGTGDVWLRLRHVDGMFTGSYSLDGSNWTELASRARTMIEPTYGVYTGRSVNGGSVPTAHFDYFSERAE
jgi:regulation of enolase protein 1 (concanavalin A-like superfamily)